jgi:hypothetical protein
MRLFWLLHLPHRVILNPTPLFRGDGERMREHGKIPHHCGIGPLPLSQPISTCHNMRRRHISKGAVPKLGAPPLQLSPLVLCCRITLMGHDVLEITVNHLAHRVALGLYRLEVPAF